MSINASAMKQQATAYRADLVGIAPVDRFAGQPTERDPLAIFPECRSVIVVGRRILRGALRGVEEGTNFHSTYGAFGLDYLNNNFLAKTTYDLTCWIEDQGYEAVPLFGYGSDAKMSFGEAVDDGKPAPNVILDIDFAAQAAGLVEIGLGGFAISPQFGTRQRFAIILTDAELEADAVLEKQLCSDCAVCMAACPLGAYGDTTRPVGLSEGGCSVAELDKGICRQCQNGARCPAGHGGSVDRLAASCGRACLVQLEKAEKLGNSFSNDFRTRAPWARDQHGRSANTDALAAALRIGCDGAGKQEA